MRQRATMPFIMDLLFLPGFDGPGTDTEWAYEKNDQYWDKDTVKLETINVSVVKESATALNLFQDGQADECHSYRGTCTANGQ